MEALALLCTLHADGPATVKRLRNVGCSSLEQLESYDPEQLADVLNVAPAVARRLGKEARVLRSRLGVGADEGLLDREEAPDSLVRSAPEPVLDALPATPALERGDRALLDRVLGRWATEDEQPREPAQLPMLERRVPAAQAAPTPAPEPEAAPEPPIAEPPPAAPTRLPVDAIEGLDASLVAQLSDAGIDSLSALAEADCRALAKTTGQSFPRLRRLQFLARRAAPFEPREEPAPVAPEPAPLAAPVRKPARFEPTRFEAAPREERGVATPPPVQDPIASASSEPSAPIPPPLGERPWIPATGEPLSESTPITEQASAPRRFWEPRKFWEARRSAAPEEAVDMDAPVVSEEEKITLDWNFEIPTPPPTPAPRDLELDDAAGPFA